MHASARRSPSLLALPPDLMVGIGMFLGPYTLLQLISVNRTLWKRRNRAFRAFLESRFFCIVEKTVQLEQWDIQEDEIVSNLVETYRTHFPLSRGGDAHLYFDSIIDVSMRMAIWDLDTLSTAQTTSIFGDVDEPCI